jgi:hypothetical protein
MFTERQHFKQIWLWALLIGINGFFIYGWISQVFLGQTFGDKPMSDGLLTLATIATFLLTVLSLVLRLDTAIQQDGIYYRFLPFQWTYRKITWDRISKAFVRQYRPITEYGGWGLRIGLFGKGKAFIVSGNTGLQIVYDKGKKFLLGTQRPEEMKRVLKQLGQLTTEEN